MNLPDPRQRELGPNLRIKYGEAEICRTGLQRFAPVVPQWCRSPFTATLPRGEKTDNRSSSRQVDPGVLTWCHNRITI